MNIFRPLRRTTTVIGSLRYRGLFENATKLIYLGAAAKNQNLALEEIKSNLNSDNACYPAVKNLLSSRLVSKNVRN
jgi:hypothetical protein